MISYIEVHSWIEKKMSLLKQARIIVAFIALIVALRESKACPSPEAINPCMCDRELANMRISCSNISDEQLSNIKGTLSGKLVSDFVIKHSVVANITEGAFQNMAIKRLAIAYSAVTNFEFFAAFRGLENSLTQITIHNVQVMNWKFSSGEAFRKVRRFVITTCGNQTLSNSFSTKLPTSLIKVTIVDCTISFQKNFTLQHLNRLASVEIRSGNLTTVNRWYLPMPASRLRRYNLIDNPITFLPENIFEQMPKLESVFLSSTRLTKLHHHIFKPVIRQLTIFEIYDIPLTCDCDAAWLLQYPKLFSESPEDEEFHDFVLSLHLMERLEYEEQFVVCSSPRSLENRTLNNLTIYDMCFNCNEYSIRVL